MSIRKDKCREWCKIAFDLIGVTKELTGDEAEYIIQNFKIERAKLKIEELEEKTNEDTSDRPTGM